MIRAHAIELAPGVVLDPQGWAARLGKVLHQARLGRRLSLRDLARESDGRFSAAELRAFERGRRPAGEQLGATLARLYGIDLAAVMPPSRAIEIDLKRGIVSAGGAVTHLREGDELAPAALSAYLELVWALRGMKRTTVPLRTGDVAVLAEALSVDEESVVAELAELMRCSPAEARRMLAVLRTRAVTVPAGVVMLLAGGALAVGQAGEHRPGAVPSQVAASTPSTQNARVPHLATSGALSAPAAHHTRSLGTPSPVGHTTLPTPLPTPGLAGGPVPASGRSRGVGVAVGASTGHVDPPASERSERNGGGSVDPGRGAGDGGASGVGSTAGGQDASAGGTQAPATPTGDGGQGQGSAGAVASAATTGTGPASPGTPTPVPGVTLVGTSKAETLTGGAGNDTLTGLAGNDTLLGGSGDDMLDGGAGNDRLTGDAGNDELIGAAGNDSLLGGLGDDKLTGDAGNDKLAGDAGNDALSGGTGNDALDGGAGNDSLDGGAGNDSVAGGEGDDTLDGGTGNDKLDGGSGNDRLDGGAGNDSVVGGEGDDTLDGGSGKDKLSGDAGNDTLDGGAGNDTLDGGAGNDTLLGGAGNDTLTGGTGGGVAYGGPGNDGYVTTDGAKDVFFGGSGKDKVIGTVEADDEINLDGPDAPPA